MTNEKPEAAGDVRDRAAAQYLIAIVAIGAIGVVSITVISVRVPNSGAAIARVLDFLGPVFVSLLMLLRIHDSTAAIHSQVETLAAAPAALPPSSTATAPKDPPAAPTPGQTTAPEASR